MAIQKIDLKNILSEKRTIYCVGRNYREHAAELNNPIPSEPLIFLKAWNSLRAPTFSEIAFSGETMHHEVEIVLRLGRDIPMASASTLARSDLSFISEIAIGLDLTRRKVQDELKRKGLPWTLAKSFKGSAVVSDFVSFNPLFLSTFFELQFGLEVNHEPRQVGKTTDMIFTPADIVRYLSSFNDLSQGDLIFTGTPAGVSEISAGQSFTMWIREPSSNFDMNVAGTL